MWTEWDVGSNSLQNGNGLRAFAFSQRKNSRRSQNLERLGTSIHSPQFQHSPSSQRVAVSKTRKSRSLTFDSACPNWFEHATQHKTHKLSLPRHRPCEYPPFWNSRVSYLDFVHGNHALYVQVCKLLSSHPRELKTLPSTHDPWVRAPCRVSKAFGSPPVTWEVQWKVLGRQILFGVSRKKGFYGNARNFLPVDCRTLGTSTLLSHNTKAGKNEGFGWVFWCTESIYKRLGAIFRFGTLYPRHFHILAFAQMLA